MIHDLQKSAVDGILIGTIARGSQAFPALANERISSVCCCAILVDVACRTPCRMPSSLQVR